MRSKHDTTMHTHKKEIPQKSEWRKPPVFVPAAKCRGCGSAASWSLQSAAAWGECPAEWSAQWSAVLCQPEVVRLGPPSYVSCTLDCCSTWNMQTHVTHTDMCDTYTQTHACNHTQARDTHRHVTHTDTCDMQTHVIHTQRCMHACTHTHARMRACTHTHTHTHTNTYPHEYTYMHTCTHIHTPIHKPILQTQAASTIFKSWSERINSARFRQVVQKKQKLYHEKVREKRTHT